MEELESSDFNMKLNQMHITPKNLDKSMNSKNSRNIELYSEVSDN